MRRPWMLQYFDLWFSKASTSTVLRLPREKKTFGINRCLAYNLTTQSPVVCWRDGMSRHCLQNALGNGEKIKHGEKIKIPRVVFLQMCCHCWVYTNVFYLGTNEWPVIRFAVNVFSVDIMPPATHEPFPKTIHQSSCTKHVTNRVSRWRNQQAHHYPSGFKDH